ncbi:MAG: hypothetical protein WBW33_09740, partial [Bryobacteraceae bacterium]
TIPRMGGTPVAIHPELDLGWGAMSPDGSKLLARAVRANESEQDLKRWWMIPISGGKPQEVTRTPLSPGERASPDPWTWAMPDKRSGRQWVIFHQKVGDAYNLFRIVISSDGKVTSDPEQLTFTTDSWGPSASENGRMVFVNGNLSTNLWSIPIDTNRALVAGERQSLTQVEGFRDQHPSLSRDGKKVAFFSGANLVVKDLVTGRETQLAQDMPLDSGGNPSISPDGSFVVFYWEANPGSEHDLYSISTSGGSPRLVCRRCGVPKGFSSDGARLLTQLGAWTTGRLDVIAMVDVSTGKVAEVLNDPQHNLWNAFYSWDDKWMVFLMQVANAASNASPFRVYITPVEDFVPAGPDRWIQLTSGEYVDNKPQLSPDGNTLYFTSNRDGFTCIWALRLDPRTKRPLGSPFPIQHFHDRQRFHSGISSTSDMELNVAKDKIVTNLDELHSEIWMMDLEPRQ